MWKFQVITQSQRHNHSYEGKQRMKKVVLYGLIICLCMYAFSTACETIDKQGMYYYCGDTRLKTRDDFEPVLSTCPAAHSEYITAWGLGIAGNVFATIGGFCLGFNLGRMIAAGPEATIPALWGIGGGSAAVGFTFAGAATAKLKSAINTYNSKKCETAQSNTRVKMQIAYNSISFIVDF